MAESFRTNNIKGENNLILKILTNFSIYTTSLEKFTKGIMEEKTFNKRFDKFVDFNQKILMEERDMTYEEFSLFLKLVDKFNTNQLNTTCLLFFQVPMESTIEEFIEEMIHQPNIIPFLLIMGLLFDLGVSCAYQ